MFPKHHNNKIKTFTGELVDLVNPSPGTIVLQDIARGLSNKGHYGGHTPFYFSIAEHSTLVHELLRASLTSEDPELELIALLHDAPEAYVGDCVKPLKDLLPEFCKIENGLSKVIFDSFGLSYERIKEIKPFDIEAQKIEWNAFYENTPNSIIKFYSPEQSFSNFLTQCREVTYKFQRTTLKQS